MAPESAIQKTAQAEGAHRRRVSGLNIQHLSITYRPLAVEMAGGEGPRERSATQRRSHTHASPSTASFRLSLDPVTALSREDSVEMGARPDRQSVQRNGK